MKLQLVRGVFIIAAIYDGVLGAAFIFAAKKVFSFYGVTPPNHPGYVQFPAALLLVFAAMFLAVAKNPTRNRNLIPYGVALKVAYSATVAYYWIAASIPSMWKPFCIADAAFIFAFYWAYRTCAKPLRY